MEVLLEEAVDPHQGTDKAVCEFSLCLDLVHDAVEEFVVQKGNTHEDGNSAALQVVDHEGYDDSMSEETAGTVLDGLKKDRCAAVGVVEGKQCIENIGFINAHAVGNQVCVTDDVPVREHCTLFISGRT